MEYDEEELLQHAMGAKSFFDVCPIQNLPPYPIREVTNCLTGLNVAEKMQITDLFAENMKDMYIASGWKWDLADKQKELFHKASRFILMKNTHDHIVAFCMFRFTWDDDDEPEYPVLYLYELQVSKDYARQGLGQFLVGYLKSLTEHFKMRKLLLTCLKNNDSALNFYRKVGLEIDSSSPSRHGYQTEYEILSTHPQPYTMDRRQIE